MFKPVWNNDLTYAIVSNNKFHKSLCHITTYHIKLFGMTLNYIFWHNIISGQVDSYFWNLNTRVKDEHASSSVTNSSA